MTDKQNQAIKALEKAFLKCQKSGLMFCGMDGDIYFATQEAIDGTEEGLDDYCPVARAVQNSDYKDDTGSVNTHRSYSDSGGW